MCARLRATMGEELKHRVGDEEDVEEGTGLSVIMAAHTFIYSCYILANTLDTVYSSSKVCSQT